MNLSQLPNWPQRQDSVTEQLADLLRVANRLGFYDAADAIRTLFETDSIRSIQHGCHVDLEPGEMPDGCVLDEGRPQDCIYAQSGMRKEQCSHWQIIKPAAFYRQSPEPDLPDDR